MGVYRQWRIVFESAHCKELKRARASEKETNTAGTRRSNIAFELLLCVADCGRIYLSYANIGSAD